MTVADPFTGRSTADLAPDLKPLARLAGVNANSGRDYAMLVGNKLLASYRSSVAAYEGQPVNRRPPLPYARLYALERLLGLPTTSRLPDVKEFAPHERLGVGKLYREAGFAAELGDARSQAILVAATPAAATPTAPVGAMPAAARPSRARTFGKGAAIGAAATLVVKLLFGGRKR